MKKEEISIGQEVKSKCDFVDVPKGTEGMIVADYGTGITIAWDLPDRPLPENKSPVEIREMWATEVGCPLRDGFDKETELQFLEVI